MLEELCTIKQACFTEKCGRTTLYKRIKDGHYTAFKIGGSTRVSVASLKAYRLAINIQITVITPGTTGPGPNPGLGGAI